MKLKVCHTSIKPSKQAFLSGLSTGLKAPSGKGSRLIIIHAGSDDGFVPNACKIFQAKKNIGDYHGEMNGDCYKTWFTTKLIIKYNNIQQCNHH